jgi:hypothetical protein
MLQDIIPPEPLAYSPNSQHCMMLDILTCLSLRANSRRIQSTRSIRNPYKVPFDPDQGSLQLFSPASLHFVSQPREAYRKRNILRYCTSLQYQGISSTLMLSSRRNRKMHTHTHETRDRHSKSLHVDLSPLHSQRHVQRSTVLAVGILRRGGGFPVFYF